MTAKKALSTIISNRPLFFIMLSNVLIAIFIVILCAIFIRPTELQVPVRYSSYGLAHFYRDKWYYLINLAAFSVLIPVVHIAITLKLGGQKSKILSAIFACLGAVLLIVSMVYIFAIMKVVSLVQ